MSRIVVSIGDVPTYLYLGIDIAFAASWQCALASHMYIGVEKSRKSRIEGRKRVVGRYLKMVL